MNFDCGGRTLPLERVAIMGVLNATPDSFFDGGRYLQVEDAIRHAKGMVAEGATVIDVGGESTRPGSKEIDAGEEIRRVVPLIRELAAELSVPISVDTSKPEVMIAAVEAGAGLINDVRALRSPRALQTACELGVPICLMHMKGDPPTMQADPRYQDVVTEVREFLVHRIAICEKAGIPVSQLLIDPGFGFGKTFEHNRRLLADLDVFTKIGPPLVVGLSRKGFVATLLGDLKCDRSIGSAGLAMLAAQKGAQVVRVHDVAVTRDLILILEQLKAIDRGIEDCTNE